MLVRLRRLPSPRSLAVSVLLLAGCAQVGVAIDTVVHDDGSFDRTITYMVMEQDRAILATEYVLPAGASWQVTEEVRPDPRGRRYVYQARGTFRTLETDYAKRDSQTPPAFSRNRLAIRATADGYAYQEAIRDTTNPRALRRVGERVAREHVARVIADCQGTVLREETPAVIAAIQRHVTTSTLGYVDHIWHMLAARRSTEDLASATALIREAEEFLISQIDRWWRTEGQHHPGEEARARIARTLTDLAEQAPDRDAAWIKASQADLARYGGAYVPSWFQRSYHFRVSVTLPTAITESNADQVTGNQATWEFDPLIFLLKEYSLVAKAPRLGPAEPSP